MRRLLVIGFLCLLWAFPRVGLAQGVLGAGYYEQNNASFTYSGTWTQNSASVLVSGGSHSFTTAVGANVSFQMTGTTLVIYHAEQTNGANPVIVCFDANCQNISMDTASGTNNVAVDAAYANCVSTCTVSITHAGTAGDFMWFDAIAIFANPPTATPIPTLPIPLPVTFAPNYPTPPPYLTQIPYPTPLPTNTALPIPLPVTFDPNNFPTPLPTNTMWDWPTPLPTWTPQSFSIDWGGFPTPLDTWTPPAAAVIEITLQGTIIAVVPTFDPAVLGTYFPTLAPTPTPTETPTPGPSPTETPSITPTPDWREYIVIDVSGTPQAVTVSYEASAGEIANGVLLFAVLLLLMLFMVLWLNRKHK